MGIVPYWSGDGQPYLEHSKLILFSSFFFFFFFGFIPRRMGKNKALAHHFSSLSTLYSCGIHIFGHISAALQTILLFILTTRGLLKHFGSTSLQRLSRSQRLDHVMIKAVAFELCRWVLLSVCCVEYRFFMGGGSDILLKIKHTPAVRSKILSKLIFAELCVILRSRVFRVVCPH